MPITRFRSVSLILLVATIAWSSEAEAQDRTGAMKFGMGIYTLLGDADYQPLPGLAASGAVRFQFEQLLIQPELQLSTRGGMIRTEYETVAGPGSARIDHGITYVDIPLLFGFRMEEGISPAIFAGPYAGVRIDSRVNLQFDDGPGSLIDPLPDVHRFDFGFTAGASAEFQTRLYRLIFDLRGMYGFAPVFQEEPSMRHAGIIAMVGIVL
jgi:hypothetical protein